MENLIASNYINEDEYNQLLQQAVALLPWGHNLLLMGCRTGFVGSFITDRRCWNQYILPKTKLKELVTDEMKRAKKKK